MRRITLLTGSAVAALALAGCGAAEQPAAPSAVAAEPAAAATNAVDSTLAEGSARTAGSVVITTDGTDYRAEFEGLLDFAGKAATTSVTTDALGSEMTVEQVVVDGVMYLELPQLPGSWVALEPRARGAESADPDEILALVDDLVEIEEVGPADVEGITVTRYSGVVDLAAAAERASEAAEVASEGSASDMMGLDMTGDFTGKLRESGLTELPFTFDVDDRGRLVAAASSASATSESGTSGSVSLDVRWFDFGASAAIEAPPADSILDLDLAGLLSRAGG